VATPSVTVYFRAPGAGSTRPIFGHIFPEVTDGTTTLGLDYFNPDVFRRPFGGPATIIRNPALIDKSGTITLTRALTLAQAVAMLVAIRGPHPATYRPLGPNCTTQTRYVLLAGGFSILASTLPRSLWDDWVAYGTAAPAPGKTPVVPPPPFVTPSPAHTRLAPTNGRGTADRATASRGVDDDGVRVA